MLPMMPSIIFLFLPASEAIRWAHIDSKSPTKIASFSVFLFTRHSTQNRHISVRVEHKRAREKTHTCVVPLLLPGPTPEWKRYAFCVRAPEGTTAKESEHGERGTQQMYTMTSGGGAASAASTEVNELEGDMVE